jgi:hypothetical protein
VTGAPAAEKMITVSEKVDLPGSAGRTWDTIKDFMGWQTWHPAFASTQLAHGDGVSKGTIRLLRTKDGAEFKEELVSVNPVTRTYQYRILQGPAPVANYVSTLQVNAHNSGSTVIWSSTFSVVPGTTEEEARKAISGIYRLGLDNLVPKNNLVKNLY